MHNSSPSFEQSAPIALFEGLVAMYILTGLAGAAWIEFDYHETYLPVLALFCIPVTAFYYGTRFLYPSIVTKFRRLFVGIRVTALISLIPAHILLINVMTSTGEPIKRDTARNQHVLTVTYEMGGLGILYRKRW